MKKNWFSKTCREKRRYLEKGEGDASKSVCSSRQEFKGQTGKPGGFRPIRLQLRRLVCKKGQTMNPKNQMVPPRGA